MDFALSGQRVAEAFDRLERIAQPRAITVDNGSEFTSNALDEWAYRNGVQLNFIRPAKPMENGLIEPFNGRLRDECLNFRTFASIEDVREKLEAWRIDYNHHRPHSSLGYPRRVRVTKSDHNKRSSPTLILKCSKFRSTSI